ncbi:hypothetical protein BKA70DRAFT_1452231 [Coprinopsis sp. MPI-PUGE-AT-0042]|nr:hypothetical protein BKA70DRAFT_1452231 [Coprinopsis sp. MPI-PUGE-AT-0042]
MAPTTRSHSRPQPHPEEVEKPPRRLSGDRFKSSRSRCLWERRNKAFSTDLVFHLGEHFARTIDPFVGIAQMVQLETQEARKYAKREQDWRNIKTVSVSAIPYVMHLTHDFTGEDLANSTPAITRAHDWDGQAKAWSADFRASHDLLSQHFGMVDCGQGFDDETIGKLLCPATCDWRNEEVKQKFRLEPYTIRVGCWPSVFYRHMEMDTQDPWKGFLRNNLLVMIYKHIFRLRVTVESRLSGADLHTTSASIAYVATLVIAALDAQDTNTRKRAKELFTMLSHHLYEHQHDSGVRELNLWWDHYHIFHLTHRMASHHVTSENTPEEPQPSGGQVPFASSPSEVCCSHLSGNMYAME